MFEVTDRGIGISLDEQQNVFNRYFRSRESEQSSVQGIGLGLYICKAIIEQHHGSIEVDSAPGEGTTFRFSFPLEATVEDASAENSSVDGENVLERQGAV